MVWIYKKSSFDIYESKKILTPDYYASASYCIDTLGDDFFFGGGAGGYGIVVNKYNPLYVLGLLNSKLINWFLQKISVRQYQTAYSYVKKYIEQIPIKPINFNDNKEDMVYNNMVSLVDHMLELHKRTPTTPHEQDLLQREIAATDTQIDRLVYNLYGLTEKEIKIIEGNA